MDEKEGMKNADFREDARGKTVGRLTSQRPDTSDRVPAQMRA